MNRNHVVALVGSCALLFTSFGYVLAQQMSPPTPKPAIDETVLLTVDLGQHFEAMRGKELRMSYAVIDPQAVGSLHSHKGWPEVVYILEGSLEEHQGGVSREYYAGESFASNTDLSVAHNIENSGSQATKVVLVEIPKD